MCERRFFADLDPIPGAIEAVKEMASEGWDVMFCTAPLRQYRYCVPEKYEWIEKHFGSEWTRRIVMTKDKTLVRARYLIDDKIQAGEEAPEWTQILFDQPYNREYNCSRIVNWKDWRQTLTLASRTFTVPIPAPQQQVSS